MSDIYVGGRPKLNATVDLADYSPGWPSLFVREEARIREVLGDVVLLEHMGSTSVPGLAAKPIIDIMMVVADAEDEDSYVVPLESAGYRLTIRETDWHGHRLLKGPDTNINLHVFPVGCAQIKRHLQFRDWLRTHDDDRLLYEREKRALAAREWEYIQEYADAKGAVVREIHDRIIRASIEPSSPVEHVVPREKLNSTIHIAPYSESWPALYAELSGRIRAALGDGVRVEHVGSTAVPGLAAKPVIDILLVVPDSADESSYVPALQAEGFWLSHRSPGHRLLKRSDVETHVHVVSPGAEDIDRLLVFRDQLRADADDRALYEQTKRSLAARVWEYGQDYADAKALVVEQIIYRGLCS
ncbi:hypothetical protein Lesp02_05100 [Lentzea sp. NBRC 105346]|uniref:GrpB family protein n=1 Tax=Lentzea sp. NBRC 105346 TaxID=3032205 RepID=UPI0024A3BE06|nr:GrpB family protein [Lentzea sp. NBRC 105346]GLZ28320.1 hypothetical protein Lesp02_05100 [Lentzea sp. NBRC 105346]